MLIRDLLQLFPHDEFDHYFLNGIEYKYYDLLNCNAHVTKMKVVLKNDTLTKNDICYDIILTKDALEEIKGKRVIDEVIPFVPKNGIVQRLYLYLSNK